MPGKRQLEASGRTRLHVMSLSKLDTKSSDDVGEKNY